jgi:hypothetical protein
MASTPESTPDEMQRRLDELGEGIDAAREQAERDGLLPEDDADEREPTLADPNPGGDADDDGMPGDATG